MKPSTIDTLKKVGLTALGLAVGLAILAVIGVLAGWV